MASLEELRNVRLNKIELLKEAQMDPYPVSVPFDYSIKEIKNKFNDLKESLAEKINQTTKEKEINKKKMGKPFDFYEMTIPIFSLDNQKAYLELNHHCGGLCGGGTSIYLRKINGKWKIVDKRQTWMS